MLNKKVGKVNRIIFFVLSILLVCSCNTNKNKKKHLAYYEYDTEYVQDEETIDIPFKVEGGVKYISAKINGVSTDMIFDTGCSETLISVLEAQQLVKRDLLSDDDILGVGQATIADGTVVEDAIINLRTIELSDGTTSIVCHNVITHVSTNIEAPALIGNGVLDRVASFTIDNEKGVIKFKLK